MYWKCKTKSPCPAFRLIICLQRWNLFLLIDQRFCWFSSMANDWMQAGQYWLLALSWGIGADSTQEHTARRLVQPGWCTVHTERRLVNTANRLVHSCTQMHTAHRYRPYRLMLFETLPHGQSIQKCFYVRALNFMIYPNVVNWCFVKMSQLVLQFL